MPHPRDPVPQLAREAKAPPPPWTCPTCGFAAVTRYCPECGERPLDARDLTLRGFMRQAAEGITSIDGRLVRSLRALLLVPGALTVAYVEGRRKPYVAPFELFLIANVLFFATQTLTHSNVLSSTLASHLHQQDWHELAQRLVSRRMAEKGTTLALYAPAFDRAVVLNAKSLVGLMVIPFALLLPLVFFGTRRPFVTHLVFSLHLYAFLLLLFCVVLLSLLVSVRLGSTVLLTQGADFLVSILIVSSCAAYLRGAAGRVYGARGPLRLVQAMLLAVALGSIVLGYRFVIFLVTLYTT